ncbi:MAG TPA: DNA polymerase Y family protein [Acidobacteriaceae bacterium]|nr:DNA polymerase Y family protein [Acidobacteriaceae bacterium]
MTPAPLYACIFAKEFPAQAMLRLRSELGEKAFVVMDGESPLEEVCSCNAKARLLGIEHGMTRVEVETFPAATALFRARAEESAAKSALLECAGTFSPRVEDQSAEDAFCCVVDIAGTEKLFGPPLVLARQIRERVRALGIAASVAVSSNFYAAVCLARGNSGNAMVVQTGEESAALAPLPLTVLDLSEEHAQTFSLWGIRTLGMLAELPETSLIARLGQEGKRLRQMARGELPHLFRPVEPTFSLEERMELDTPVELLDSLLFVIGVMLDQLILRATARSLALASVAITLLLDGGESHTRTVRPALPSNDRHLWLKLLHLDMEAHPPGAAIVGVTTAAEPGSTSKVQLGLFSPQLPEPARLGVTLARIRAIVGEDCVGRAVLKDSHRPDAFRMEPFTASLGPAESKLPQARSGPAMRQIRPPECVPIMLRDTRPVSFTFRAKRYNVESAYGPWRINGDWWSPGLWGVQQWDVVTRAQDGTFLCGCLMHDLATGAWQVEALYD